MGIQPTWAQSTEVDVSPAPEWVTKIEAKSDGYNAGAGSGTYYLLVDYQDHVERQEEYAHYAFKIQNNEGLRNSSDIQVDFDPAYQTLTFHEVSIYRDGRKIDKLALDQINTFRKEDNADRYLYDGSIRAVINLTDVRVGDVIEYAYTVKGFNPLYEGNYFAKFYLKSGLAYEEMQVRILAAQNRPLNFRYFNGADKPRVTRERGLKEYLWKTSDTTPQLYDSNTPGWYNPYPQVAVSSFDSWSDLVEWALPHYTFDSSELRALQLTTGNMLSGTDEDKIRQAIRFVQDEIRYLGFESGMSAYKPNDPHTVFKRRFGDCKDKSVLLAALLQAEGISAHPMLVSASRTKGIAGRLPSPEEFDHCVVQITREGKELFVDPTISNQGGTLDNLYFPNYGKGLVLKRGVEKLADLPVSKESRIAAKETFTFDETGEGATLDIETEYYGARADYQRAYFSNYSLDQITKDYVSYYASVFPSINSVTNVEFIDEDRNGSNMIVVKERYEIPEIWQSSEGSGTIFAEIYPIVLQSYLSTSVSADRKAPLYIGEPTSYIQETLLEMPEAWLITEDKQEINSAGFQYRFDVTSESEKLIRLNYEYHILQESVPVDHIAGFIADQKEIENSMVFSLTYDTALAGYRFSWLSLAIFLAGIAVSFIIARHFYLNYDPKPEYSGEARKLGGWLILFVIGIALSPVRIAYDLIVNHSDMFNHGIWTSLLNSGGANYNPELAILIVFETLYNGFIIIFSLLVLILVIQKRSSVPRLAIAYMVISLVVQFIDTFMATALIEGAFTQAEIRGYYGEILRSFLSTCIWVPYLLLSKRVKETFVRRADAKPGAVSGAGALAEGNI